MSDKVTIVIADDHPLYRTGLRQIIETEPELEILAEAGDGESALKLIRRLKPSIAILDISMPQLDGFAAAKSLSEEGSPVSVIFLTMYQDKKLFDRALNVGVKGYVLKDSAAGEIVSAIRAVVRGQHFVSPELTSQLIEASRLPIGKSGQQQHGNPELSPMELRVLELIADYKTSKQIADELCISRRTVEAHRTHICQKRGLHGSHALMKFALDHKSSSLAGSGLTPDK